jgi:hypothetical protein
MAFCKARGPSALLKQSGPSWRLDDGRDKYKGDQPKGRRTKICGHGLLCRGYNIATDAFSKKYAVSPTFGENTGARFQNRKGEQPMTEKAFRFSASTINELNRPYQPGNKRLPATQFALILLTLAALLILIYAQIVW